MTPYGVLLSLVLSAASACSSDFPSGFKFGAASSAYQVEGAWNTDGKGENIWDRFIHSRPDVIFDNTTGDVTASSYHKWRDDVTAAANLGLQFYRFSISWTRLFPTGFTNEINEAGVQYYSDLIDGLLSVGVEPVATLYHWDLPVKLQDLGGWTNPLIAQWFGDYAQKVFELYADRVKTWITLNEADLFCDYGYVTGTMAPGIKEGVFAPYICGKNALLAHATAYRVYDQQFRGIYGGRVTIALHSAWFEPETENDELRAEMALQLSLGRYSHPIFSKEGGWPPSIDHLMWNISIKQGHSRSRLPYFTAAEKEFVKGTADFFALNYYTARSVRQAKPGEEISPIFFSGSEELEAIMSIPANSYYTASPIIVMYPEGLRQLLSWIKRNYGNLEIVISENGYPSAGLELNDFNRIKALREHLEQIQLSIRKDGVNVTGYTHWSLVDDFEWLSGFSTRFGLHQIDFNDPELSRTPRLSSKYYSCVIKQNSLDVSECFDINIESIDESTDESTNKSVDESMDESIDESTDESIDESTDRSIDESLDDMTSRRGTLPNLPIPNIGNSVSFVKDVYENRKCIVKVMKLASKMSTLVGNN